MRKIQLFMIAILLEFTQAGGPSSTNHPCPFPTQILWRNGNYISSVCYFKEPVTYDVAEKTCRSHQMDVIYGTGENSLSAFEYSFSYKFTSWIERNDTGCYGVFRNDDPWNIYIRKIGCESKQPVMCEYVDRSLHRSL